MIRIYRAAMSLRIDIKSNPDPYRKLFGVYFAAAIVIFIISTFINSIFNAGLIGKGLGSYINLILMFILFHAFFCDSKSFVGSASIINPRILLNLFVILLVCKIPIDIWNVFSLVYGTFFDSAFFSSSIVELLSSVAAIILLVFEYCLLIFTAENPDEKVGTTLFGGLSLMRKLFFPIFILLVGLTVFTLLLTAIISLPLKSLVGDSTVFQNITSIIVNIISIALTFLYGGVFARLSYNV
jgi:hypothetical protein